MDDQHYDALQELSHCRFQVGSYDKRFVRDLSSLKRESVLTPKQIRHLKKTYYRYRKQILARNPDAEFDWTFDADDPPPEEPEKTVKYRPKRKRYSHEELEQMSALRARYGTLVEKIADFWSR